MYFSMIRMHRYASPNNIATFCSFNGYKLHKAVWNLFSDSPDRLRDFLYRYEAVNGRPIFYTVSERKPEDQSGIFDITSKPYEPKLMRGERLSFKLRANPVQLAKKERNAEEEESWRKSREKRGLKSKETTKKRIRHDVVMSAKNDIGYKELPKDQKPHLATLIQNVGATWLRQKSQGKGFVIEGTEKRPEIKVDGYCQQRFYKGKGKKPIKYSTLEFDGVLKVTNPEIFIRESLFKGIGPAKGFGCGLMMVKRI